MTYIIYVISIVIFSIGAILFNKKLYVDASALGTFLMLIVFSFSSNSDHQNYQNLILANDYTLFEPISKIYMLIGSYILKIEYIISIGFATVYFFSRKYGNYVYNQITLLYLGPIGVVSPRFFIATLLISTLLEKKHILPKLAPMGIHYATILPIIALKLKPITLIIVSIALVLLFDFNKEFFILIISLSGINYERYLDNQNSYTILTIIKYTLIPILMIIFKNYFNIKKSHYKIALTFSVTSAILRIGLTDFEVISRIASVLNCIALYYILMVKNVGLKILFIFYVVIQSITFAFFGWEIYPEVYQESDQWIEYFDGIL